MLLHVVKVSFGEDHKGQVDTFSANEIGIFHALNTLREPQARIPGPFAIKLASIILKIHKNMTVVVLFRWRRYEPI